MKRIIMILTLSVLVITGCNDSNKDEPIATYRDNVVYDYQINEFVKMKTRLMEIYYNNLDDVNYTVPINGEITGEDYLEYMKFCQMNLAENEISKYLDLTDEEKEIDYFVSMERRHFFSVELQENNLVQYLYEYNKQQINENIETMCCGTEIMASIEELAIESDFSVKKYIEEVYLNVALDLSLQDYKSDVFLDNYFEGEVYQEIDGDVFLNLSTTKYPSEKLKEFCNISENYYNFLYEYSNQLYSFLKEEALSEVIFY